MAELKSSKAPVTTSELVDTPYRRVVDLTEEGVPEIPVLGVHKSIRTTEGGDLPSSCLHDDPSVRRWRSLRDLPVSALVGPDAAEEACGLELGDVLLDGLARDAKCRGHADLRQMRLRT